MYVQLTSKTYLYEQLHYIIMKKTVNLISSMFFIFFDRFQNKKPGENRPASAAVNKSATLGNPSTSR